MIGDATEKWTRQNLREPYAPLEDKPVVEKRQNLRPVDETMEGSFRNGKKGSFTTLYVVE